MSVKDENLSRLLYKDGTQVQYATHLQDSDWHRGCSYTTKSRKLYTCALGCELPAGSGYTSLSMMAGCGLLDGFVYFALCDNHLHETESLLKQTLDDAETEFILECWLKILDER